MAEDRQAEEKGLRKLTYEMKVYKKQDAVLDYMRRAKREFERFKKRKG